MDDWTIWTAATAEIDVGEICYCHIDLPFSYLDIDDSVFTTHRGYQIIVLLSLVGEI